MVILTAAVILAIALLQGIIVTLIVRRKKEEGKSEETNHLAFFILGIVWMPISIILSVISFKLQIPFYIAFPLFIMGFVYLLNGLKKSKLMGGTQ